LAIFISFDLPAKTYPAGLCWDSLNWIMMHPSHGISDH